MKNCLIVVDMQNDFVNGSLGSDDANKIVQPLVEKVKNFCGKIIFTQDSHNKNYLDTQEGELLPITHCIKNSIGWNIIDELKPYINEDDIYLKNSFASIELAEDIKNMYENKEIDSVEIVGLCTDVCVVSNALVIKAFSPELPVYVDSKCCAGITPEKHSSAIETMKSCQVRVL